MPAKPPDSDESPSKESSVSTDTKADLSPYNIGSKYKYFRQTIVNSGSGGQLLWDGIRIVCSVTIIMGILFALTGLTTPIAGVLSGSMEPNINTGDGVIVTKYTTDNPPILASHAGVITLEESQEQPGTHTSFGKEGDIIIFEQTTTGRPIIHRTHLRVDKGENWVKRADPSLLGNADSCDEIHHCPAPNAGFITNGDNNDVYDQTKTQYRPVSQDRVIGVAQYRIPHLGKIPNGIDLLTPW